LSVTLVNLLRPVILTTLFSFELPLRYSVTPISASIGPTSWKPALTPSLPAPKSTRKLKRQ